MNLRTWLISCISSGLEQSAKLGLVILSAFTMGQHLDVHTLLVSVSVGWLFGILQWMFFNPLKNVLKEPVTPTQKDQQS